KHCYWSKKIKLQGQRTAQNSEKTVSQSQHVTHWPVTLKKISETAVTAVPDIFCSLNIAICRIMGGICSVPAHGQRRSAERAKTGDILKAKIQQRPPRHELERRHILEAEALHADPSLAERQRMLKKARLADQLNDQLSHRPGPLELIQKNILHTEEPIEEAVKTGKISYKATSEGALKRPQHPQNYVNPDEDSQGSSEGDATVSPGPSDVLETAAKSAGIVVSFQPAEGTVVLATATPGQSKDCSDIVFADLCRPLLSQGSSKSTPKARTIKFHEYKGPPSALKSCSTGGASGESSYDLLLKQQTLLLQFQLQLQHKYPQIILPASQKAPPIEPANGLPSNAQQPSPAPSTCSETSMPGRVNLPGKLEDMKVSDLKAELKRRNLPVSGCKPQLIERLKSCASQSQPSSDNPASVDSSVTSSMDQSHNSPTCQDLGSPQEQDLMEVGDPVSPAPSQQSQDSLQRTNEDLVREQKRQIEVLQRELTLSQLRLQALNSTRAEPNTQMVLQKHLQAKQQAAQQQQQNIALQMRQLQAEAKQAQVNEEQQRLQQQQHVAFQNQKNLGGLVINGDQKNVGVVLNGAEAAFVYQLMQCKPAKLINGHSRPSFVLADVKREYIEEVKQPPEIKIEYSDVSQSPKPPPLYTDATAKKSSVKSQTVDDVLEILIKNGELPPSAASYPSTPGSAGPQRPGAALPQLAGRQH
ncbi:hypothetical protein D910_03407, partial [Dendroctonus ponderosae]